jgi:hypothetical protein
VQIWLSHRCCQEFERDTLVSRLSSGLVAAKAKTKERTQTGDKKVQGSKSTLEIRMEGLEEGTQQEDTPRCGYEYRKNTMKVSCRGRNSVQINCQLAGSPPASSRAGAREDAGGCQPSRSRFSQCVSPDGYTSKHYSLNQCLGVPPGWVPSSSPPQETLGEQNQSLAKGCGPVPPQ